VRALLISDRRVTGAFSNCARYIASGRGWLAGDWPSTGGVLDITAAAWTAGFQWWRSGDITRTQNGSEYMLVLALCLVRSVLDPTHPEHFLKIRTAMSKFYFPGKNNSVLIYFH